MTFDVGGGVYFAGTDLGNSIFHHNVFHDIMGELSTGFYLDNMCSNVVYHHNISYNTSYTGFTLGPPCAFVLVFNNTCYNKGNAFGFNRENNTCAGVRFYNNIFSEIHPDFEDGGAIVTPNLITTATSHWVNAASNDFRLRSGSAAVNIGTMIPFITDNVSDGRPDAGALELGETIWEYGHNFTTPPNPTYDWFLVSFLNVVENPSFETGLAPWTIVTGTPSIINGNSWNYKDDALAIAGSNALELKPGDKVQQKLSGLMKNTTYMFKFSARLVKDLQIEKYDAKSSSGTQGYYRAEDCMQNLRSGDWFQFNQFDFGTSSRFNRVEIGNCLVPSMSVEVRLDSPTGTLVASIPLESGDRWYATGTSIQSVTGVHNVYLVIKSNMATGYLDRIRFLNTANTEKVTFGVSDFDPAQGPKSENTGGSAWQNGSIMFKTGPASTSATLFIEKSGGELNGYVDQTRVSTESVTSIAPNAESVRNTVLYRIHSKYLHVFGLDRQGNNQISLISLNGRMVKKVTVSEKSECILGLQGVSQGIYFLQVVSRDRNFRERIIITR